MYTLYKYLRSKTCNNLNHIVIEKKMYMRKDKSETECEKFNPSFHLSLNISCKKLCNEQ